MLKMATLFSSCLAVSFVGMQAAQAADAKVVIGEINNVGARVMTYVLTEAIESRFPTVNVESVPASVPVIFEAMDRGRGDIDVQPDLWLPNNQPLVEEYVEKRGTVKMSEGSYEGFAGYCVPSYVAEENNIKSVFDLATPRAAELFDSDGDGKGEMWVGGPGWVSANRYLVQFRDYGIGNFFEPTRADETIAYAELGDAIKKKEPYLFACYGPHYIFELYDLVMLQEPAFEGAEKHNIVGPKQEDWFEKSVAFTAADPRHVHVAYSVSLEERLPDVARFLSNVAMDAETMTKLSSEIVQKGRDAQEVAREWVQANSARVDGWLKGD